MQDIDSSKNQHRNLLFFLALFVVVCISLGLYTFIKWDLSKAASRKAEGAERLLTKEHGDEALKAVKYFEMNWMSLEMHSAPERYFDRLLTGPLLSSYINRANFREDVNWLIPRQTDILDLRVIEYMGESMRVIACINQGINKTDHFGKVIEHYPLHKIVIFYIFILDDDTWKVENFLDITDPKQALQDWDFMPQNLKEITGEINSLVYKSCDPKK